VPDEQRLELAPEPPDQPVVQPLLVAQVTEDLAQAEQRGADLVLHRVDAPEHATPVARVLLQLLQHHHQRRERLRHAVVEVAGDRCSDPELAVVEPPVGGFRQSGTR